MRARHTVIFPMRFSLPSFTHSSFKAGDSSVVETRHRGARAQPSKLGVNVVVDVGVVVVVKTVVVLVLVLVLVLVVAVVSGGEVGTASIAAEAANQTSSSVVSPPFGI